jgi:hypothetical protein
MNRRFTLIVLGLVICAGCGDIGGNRRQASGSIGGTGLVGSDINSLASGPTQPAAAPSTQVAPPTTTPAAQPNQPAAPPAATPTPQPATVLEPNPSQPGGTLPGLPGVTLPGQAQPGVVTEKAQVGATGKGNYGSPGIVTTPISVYFQAQEQLIFLSVQHAVDIYQGLNGYKPKSEDEFMKEIIEANQIKLPQLPPGHKYKYDPQKGELMVERPQ